MKKFFITLSIFLSVFFISSDHFAFADYQPDQVVYFDMVSVGSSEWHFSFNPNGEWLALLVDSKSTAISFTPRYYFSDYYTGYLTFSPDLARSDFIVCNNVSKYFANSGYDVNTVIFCPRYGRDYNGFSHMLLRQSNFGFDPYNPPPLVTPAPIIPSGTTEEYLDFGFNFLYSFISKTLHVLFLYDLGRILVYTLILSVVGGLLYFFIRPGGR